MRAIVAMLAAGMALFLLLRIVLAVHRLLTAIARGTASAWQTLARLVELLLLGSCVAVPAGVAVGMVTARQPRLNPVASGALAGVLVMPVALATIGWVRSRRARAPAPSPVALSRFNPVLPAQRAEVRAAPPVASLLDIAWDEAADEIGWAASRIAVARASCAALLRQAEADPLDIEAVDWAQVIRRRVPELVDAGLARDADATASEREAVREELVESLERVAAEAERRRRRTRRTTRERFDTLRTYVDGRTREDGP